jgi:hypothetical protein
VQIDPRMQEEADEELEAWRRQAGVKAPRFAGAGDRLRAWWYGWSLWLLVVGGLLLALIAVVVGVDMARTGRLPWVMSATPAPATRPAAGPTLSVGTPAGTTSPATIASAGAAQATPAPTTIPTVAPTMSPAPATPTLAPPTPTATFDPRAKQGMGEGLREIKAAGAPGVDVGDGGRGDALKQRFLDAMKVWNVDILNGDGSRVDEYFTGELRENALLRLANVQKEKPGDVTQILLVDHRVMDFIQGDGTRYIIYDSQDVRPRWQKRGPDGRLGEIIRDGELSRRCETWTLVPVDGVYKVARRGMVSGTAARGCLPEYRLHLIRG